MKTNWKDTAVQDAVNDIKSDVKELDVDAAVEIIKKFSEENSDNKGFKTVQGLIYKKGYEDGTLKAQ